MKDFTHDFTQDSVYIPFVELDEETRNREQLGYTEQGGVWKNKL